jgi:hypothetical protein
MSKRTDIRRHKRNSFSAIARVGWQDRLGREKFLNARVFDISESGLSLQLPEAVDARCTLTLRSEKLGLHALGSVRHCARAGGRYLVGVEFTGGFRWKAPNAEVEAALREADALAPS